MASIYDLKPRFQNLLRPISHYLAKNHVTPNQVTLIALFISFLTGMILFSCPTSSPALLLIPAILFIRMVLNAIDGMLAREHNMKSHLGIFLNELGDVLSDTFLYLPFAFIPTVSPFLIITIVFLAALSEMTGVIAMQVCQTRRYEGPMGKSDRAFAFGFIATLLAIGIPAGGWLNVYFTIVAILLLVTINNRLRNSLRAAS